MQFAGRPLGMLGAWLLAGAEKPYDTRADHFAARLGKGSDSDWLSFERRRAARAHLERDPEWSSWMRLTGCRERPTRGTDGPEPERLV